MLKALNTNFPDLTERDRNTLLKAGILNDNNKKEVIKLVTKWKKEISEDRVGDDMLYQIIKYVDLKINIVQDALNIKQNKINIQNIIEKAQQNKVNNALIILNISLNYKKSIENNVKNHV